MKIHLKRIYDAYDAKDGYRILIDRLWPRGMKKEDASIDTWMKEIAPSAELRQWYNHDPGKWEEFYGKYVTELKGSEALETFKKELGKHKTVTLLTASKEMEYNHGTALMRMIDDISEKTEIDPALFP